MEIFVKTLTGKTLTVPVQSQMKVDELKCWLGNNECPPPDVQRLMFQGKQLEDHLTLGAYNIRNESTLHLVIRNRGGMFTEESGKVDFRMMAADPRQCVAACGVRRYGHGYRCEQWPILLRCQNGNAIVAVSRMPVSPRTKGTRTPLPVDWEDVHYPQSGGRVVGCGKSVSPTTKLLTMAGVLKGSSTRPITVHGTPWSLPQLLFIAEAGGGGHP